MSIDLPKIYFAACLLMITICVYGAFVRLVHICPQYKANHKKVFPARKILIWSMMLHLLFLPYLFNVGTELGVRYATTLLFVTHPFMYSMLIDYAFFLNKLQIWRVLCFGLIIGAGIVLPLMYYIEANDMISDDMLRLARALPTMIFVIELFYIVSPIRKLTVKITTHNHQRYSSDKDFPFPFAYLTLIPVYLSTIYIVVMYYQQSEIMLMVFNFVFAFAIGFLAVYTMKPIRDISTIKDRMEPETVEEDVRAEADGEPEDEEKHEQAADAFDEESLMAISSDEQAIIDKLDEVMREKQLFKLSYLKITDIHPLLGVSRLILTNAIAKSEYGSFYNMVNTYRLRYAMDLMRRMADFKLQDISIEAGFSSQSQFNQFFKESTGRTPTKWLKMNKKG